MKLKFWKYEATGSDFILIDGRKIEGSAIKTDGEATDELPGDLIRAMCNRQNGVGAFGLLILVSEEGYDFRMKYYNYDGSELSVCGNGARSIVLFAHHLGIGGMEKHFIGKDGEHRARILSDNGESAIIEIGMNDVNGYEYSEKAFYLNTGMPHYVEFVEELENIDVEERGNEISNSERFKSTGGTNVNFVEVLRHGQIKIRTYDRRTDRERIASGTGAVACAIATHLYAQNDADVFTASTAGGNLEIKFTPEDKQAFTNVKLTGPTKRVFEGIVYSGNLI